MSFDLEAALREVANGIDSRAEARAMAKNDAPCVRCGSQEFIQLYRNVVGEVEGSMQGSFSLFGGSVWGYISGYTKTLPVLSCTNCHNERTISTWQPTRPKDVFWDDMHQFYFYISERQAHRLKEFKDNPRAKLYLEHPVETRQYMLDNKNWEYTFYNSMAYWSTETWKQAGFKIEKTPVKQHEYKIFGLIPIRWETGNTWPTWKELGGVEAEEEVDDDW